MLSVLEFLSSSKIIYCFFFRNHHYLIKITQLILLRSQNLCIILNLSLDTLFCCLLFG